MARNRSYSPRIERDLVSALYHEAKHRRIPMTKLVDDLLRPALKAGETTRLREETRQDYRHR
ncbi:hypothetical protein [Haloferula sp. A504]|uniref:hypothetical protein n=1 Tax=Haloferula sp. A504 TaxID=3373601 RepID=UPI0031BCEA4F|nr:hypothetical protein [Verrucomicrobiaceae bacterium E54]